MKSSPNHIHITLCTVDINLALRAALASCISFLLSEYVQRIREVYVESRWFSCSGYTTQLSFFFVITYKGVYCCRPIVLVERLNSVLNNKRIIFRKVCNHEVFTFFELFLSLLNKPGLHFCCKVMYCHLFQHGIHTTCKWGIIADPLNKGILMINFEATWSLPCECEGWNRGIMGSQ